MPTVSEALALAIAQHRAGHLDFAVEVYRRILAAEPEHAEALHLLGVAACQRGQHAAALEPFGQAIALRPTEAVYHASLGEAYRALGRHAEALDCYHRALELEPRLAAAHNNLGNCLRDLGKTQEALAAYRQALQCQPDFADAYTNMGCVLRELGQLDQAIECQRRAIELAPQFAEAYNNLGNAWKEQGVLDEALACFQRALQLRSRFPQAHANLIYALHFCPDVDPTMLCAEARRWNRDYAEPLGADLAPHANRREPDRRLKIGYVSPDFRDHVIGRNLLPLLREHDHCQFEVFCYSSAPMSDAVTEQCRAAADAWRDVARLTDEQLAALVRADQIDVLVDLTLHMAHNRLLVFARKPAPVQVTFAGYPGTTGLTAIGYRLTDPWLDPPGSNDEHYTERSIRLADSFWCYDPPRVPLAVGPLPAATAGHVTFGCLNNFCKITPAMLRLWAEVLRSLEDSQLVLVTGEGVHRQRTQALFAQQGIDARRVRFVSYQPRDEYLRLYQQIDVGLDTLPYNGHSTTLDALWMGVPVVSLVGRTAVGRGGRSILSNLGLPELAATEAAQYVATAVGLAQDQGRLAALRSSLRARLAQSVLMDAPRFAQSIEQAYRGIWRAWCNRG
jgi:predicted O-linked N-acetylglucosamine transferase (SPINDLY family)